MSSKCKACGLQIDARNEYRPLPAWLSTMADDAVTVPDNMRGCGWKSEDGCERCMNNLVHEFALHLLQRSRGHMEDVAVLISEHLGLDLPRKVTA